MTIYRRGLSRLWDYTQFFKERKCHEASVEIWLERRLIEVWGLFFWVNNFFPLVKLVHLYCMLMLKCQWPEKTKSLIFIEWNRTFSHWHVFFPFFFQGLSKRGCIPAGGSSPCLISFPKAVVPRRNRAAEALWLMRSLWRRNKWLAE